MASATTGAGWGRDQGPRRTYRWMRTRAYRSQLTAEGRKNQHFPTRRAGQLRPKENHGHTASHSALDTQVSRDSAPGSSHHTKELTSIQQRPLRAYCVPGPPSRGVSGGGGGRAGPVLTPQCLGWLRAALSTPPCSNSSICAWGWCKEFIL